MQCEIRTYIGSREEQEDSSGYCETDKGLFVVVCDGIGSRKAGGDSARLAVDLFLDMYRKTQCEHFPNFIVDAASIVDQRLYDNYGNNCGTTAVTAYIHNDSLYWFAVGDSRLYILREGRLKQITTDHNYAYVLSVRKNKSIINSEVYQKEISKGSQLVSFLGMGGIDLVDLNFQPFMLQSGDLVLLTTDGLYNALPEDKIISLLSEKQNVKLKADLLINAVKSCESILDNTTFALINYSEDSIT